MIRASARWAKDNFKGEAKRMQGAERTARHKTAAEVHKAWASDVRFDEGVYRGSIKVDPDEGNTTFVSAHDDLMKVLSNEFGNSRGMAPRPSATQAAETHRARLVDNFKQAYG